MLNEPGLARALYRGALFVVALVALVLIGVQLKWVLLQLFAAATLAAGMAPVLAWVADPDRSAAWRWRPPRALGVVGIYLVAGLVLLVLSAVLLRVLLSQGTLLAQRAPEYAAAL